MQGRATTDLLSSMKREEATHRSRRQKLLERCRSPACGAFQLAIQIQGNQEYLQSMAPKILQGCAAYLQHTKAFAEVSSKVFDRSYHGIIVGWHDSSGTVRLKTQIVDHPRLIDAQHIKSISQDMYQAYTSIYPAHVAMIDSANVHV
ncbi:MAG: hypothetical protein EOO52_13695 [Gammaproteobacteria bacterium]|nr:MAG: hypothetical protein EOO52_13695 [Gammaproteobacteria bacterium]